MPILSREQRVYLAIWRRALSSEETIRVNCSTRHMAIAMRQGMYRAMRPYREAKLFDGELQTAADRFVVWLSPKDGDKHWFEMRERKTLSELEQQFGLIGIDETDLLFGAEREAIEGLKELIEKPNAEPAKPVKTKFYSRD